MAHVRLLDTAIPIVAAPMAGGPTTVALAAAVADAGAFGFLAGGYKTVAQLADETTALGERTRAFGVNLFVPGPPTVDLEEFRAYAAELVPDADAHGVRLDASPVHDDDGWVEKLQLLLARPVPVVSFTFGLPEADEISALRRAGSRVLATVTTLEEARAAHRSGVDGLIVQGSAAGGHSATFDPHRDPSPAPTTVLVRRVVSDVRLPVVAAGGVDGAAAVGDLLDAGAESVAVGTLLLRTHEAGTSPTHRAALASPAARETLVTRAFTGRPARSLRNDFVDRHDATAPVAYPEVHHLTRALRAAAGRSGDAERLHLWAGTGYRAAREEPAGAVVRRLAHHS